MMTRRKINQAFVVPPDQDVSRMVSRRRANAGTWSKDNPPTVRRGKVPAEFTALMREYSVAAAEELMWWALQKDGKQSVTACMYIINRAWGAPVQMTELSGPNGTQLSPPDLIFISATNSPTINGKINDVDV